VGWASGPLAAFLGPAQSGERGEALRQRLGADDVVFAIE